MMIKPSFFSLFQLAINPIAALSAIHRIHGDLFATRFFNKKLLFISNPEYLDDIYSLEAKHKISRDFLHNILRPVFFNGLLNSKTDTWAKQRRLMQPLFTANAITAWEPLIENETASIIDSWGKTSTVKINLTKELKILIQSIFLKALFGHLDADTADNDGLTKALNTALDALLPRIAAETLGKGKFNWLLFAYQDKKSKAAIREITNFIHQELDTEKQQFTHSILSYLQQAEDKKTGYKISKDLLIDEVIGLFIAGQDTTLNALIWFFYLIANDKDIHKKVTDEIDGFRGEPVNSMTIGKLKFTRAVLYEALRLYPPAPGLIREALEDVVVGGQKIAKGTSIIINVYAIHRNSSIWETPNTINPNHFLEEQTISRHKYAFMPFGGGIHNCIGKHFAELEMMIIITLILRSYKIDAHNNLNIKASVTLKADRDLFASLIPQRTTD
jgi:cytochrome P450